jgi:enoyl-CoA hydratase/carnithine racemase
VRGRCEGAGTALALSADLAVADSTAQLKFLESDGAPPPLLAVLLAGRLDRGGAAKLLLGDHGLSGEQAVLRGLMSDCATGWEGAGAIVERHVRQLALAPNRETLQQVIQTIRAPLLTWMGESLPSVERRAVERAGRSEETTASPKWRPGY